MNGVARKVKSAYVGVNGVARKFWPRIVYVWNRYNINYTWSYSLVASGGSMYHPYSGAWGRSYYNVNISTETAPTIDATGSVIWNGNSNVITIDDDIYRVDYHSPNYYYYIRLLDFGNRIIRTNGAQLYVTDYNYRYETVIQSISASSVWTMSTTPNKGSYIDQVFSEKPNTYPQNNRLGIYWYVYQGTQG